MESICGGDHNNSLSIPLNGSTPLRTKLASLNSSGGAHGLLGQFWKKSSNYFFKSANVGPSSSIEVLHIQDAMKIIQEQIKLGFDIPLCIKAIIKVKKMLDFK